MTFQEWVDENGGQIGVARKFGFTSSLIGAGIASRDSLVRIT